MERASHFAGKTTDVETEMIYSEFLKPGTGEYPTSRREKSESAFSLMGGTILLFLVPQIHKQFSCCGTVPGILCRVADYAESPLVVNTVSLDFCLSTHTDA